MGLTVFDVMGHSAHILPTNPHPHPHIDPNPHTGEALHNSKLALDLTNDPTNVKV